MGTLKADITVNDLHTPLEQKTGFNLYCVKKKACSLCLFDMVEVHCSSLPYTTHLNIIYYISFNQTIEYVVIPFCLQFQLYVVFKSDSKNMYIKVVYKIHYPILGEYSVVICSDSPFEMYLIMIAYLIDEFYDLFSKQVCQLKCCSIIESGFSLCWVQF